jgi:hypothetical protein
MGETAMSPIIVELGTVEIPVFARMTYSSAVPRSTALAPLAALTMAAAESKNKVNFMLDLNLD